MSQDVKLANPGPLGLWGFAATTWLLSQINAGWSDSGNLYLVLPMAFVFGGTAQIIAGILEYRRGNTLGFVAFIGYGSFWWVYALFIQFFSKGNSTTEGFVGVWLVIWGIFTFVLFLASLAKNRALQAILFFLTLTFLALGFADILGLKNLTILGGYLGLITALIAAYLGSAEIINESFDREVFPIGQPKQ